MKFFKLISSFAASTSTSPEAGESMSELVKIDFSRLFGENGSLAHMGIGMLSIFIVIFVIILSIYAMNKIMNRLDEKKAESEVNKNN